MTSTGADTVDDSQYPPLDLAFAYGATGSVPYFDAGNRPIASGLANDQDDDLENERQRDFDLNFPDQEFEGVPHHSLALLDVKNPGIDKDFIPELGESEFDSDEADSISNTSAETLAEAQGRRGPSRGRGRGQSRARGSRGGHGGRTGLPRGRPRGSKMRGSARGHDEPGRGRGPGRRGPRPIADPGIEFKEVQAKATTAFLEARYEDAAEYAKQAIQLNPEVFAAHSLLSQVYFELGNKEESLAVLWSGAHTKRETGVWWEVANRTSELGEGNHEATMNQLMYCYSQITTLDPKDYEARKNKLDIYIEQKHIGRAVRECESMLKLRPNDLDIIQVMADQCLKGDDPKRAKKAYATAVEHFRQVQHDAHGGEFTFDDLNIYLDLFAHLKQWEEGMVALKSIARWLCGRKDEDFWERYVDDDREWDIKDRPRRVMVPEFKQGKHTEDAYGLQLPAEIRAKFGIFRLHHGPHYFDEAMHHFNFFLKEGESVEANANDYPDLFGDIAGALYHLGHHHEALIFFEYLSETDASLTFEECIKMAKSYKSIDQLAQALRVYNLADEMNPHKIEIKSELAKVYEELKQPEEASKQTAEVIRLTRLDAEERLRANKLAELDEASLNVSQSDPAFEPTVKPKPKPPRKKYTFRAPNTQLEEQKLLRQEQIQAIYEHLQSLTPGMRDDEEEATSKWIESAESLIQELKSYRAFYPSDRNLQYLGDDREAKRKAQDIFRSQKLKTDAESLPGERIPPNGDFRPAETFQGISLDAWLDIFCEYAFLAARNGDRNLAYATLASATEPSVFYQHEKRENHIYVCYFACAFLLDDEERLTNTARWFIRRQNNNTESFQLYGLLHRIFRGAPSWYHSGPSQKFLMRQIKAIDFALLDDDTRKKWRFTEQDYRSYVPMLRDDVKMNPCLLTLYGHILASSASFQNALNYYLRAYALVPDDPMILLSIALSYLQYSIKRQAENRHYLALQGLAFFNEYKKVRLTYRKNVTRREHYNKRMEVEYNTGRFWHFLGLLHLAVPAYEKCLTMEIDGEMEMPNCGSGHTVGGWAPADATEIEPDFKREAAFALQGIMALAGNTAKARALTQKWLVF